MEFRVLGQLEVVRDGDVLDLGSSKQKALLALLLIYRNRVLPTDRIIDEIWGDDARTDRKNALHVYLSNLRKVLEPERAARGESTVILTRSPGYTIKTGPGDVDIDRFESALAEGRALLGSDPASASIVLGEGLALWRGLPFEEFTYSAFAQAEIARLNEVRLETVEARVDADLARGFGRELISELESLHREHPFRERLAGQLMLSLYRSGRQADALRIFQQTKGRLGQELGVEPSLELQDLEERIVVSDASLIVRDSTLLLGDGPAPGLAVRGYELRERIGSGRFGIAYRAFQRAVGREVAVKVIRPEFADDPRFIRAFEDEAQVIARLEHPNIVPLYDYWREPGAGYLVMRLMQGGSLETVLSLGPMEHVAVGKLVTQVGDALETAHRSGVIHLDIKPSNILIDAEGNALLSDFGIASSGGNGSSSPSLEPPYLPPEVLGSEGMSTLVDIYSLAVVAAEALTGRSGEPGEQLVGMEPAIAEVLAKATSADPEHRYADIGVFVDEFLRALGGVEKSAQPLAEVENPYKGLRAFQQADSADFFGREKLVERLVARLGTPGARGRFVGVVGPSGSGKSSLVKAGLLAALRRGGVPGSAGWYQIEMKPGQHPYSALEEALMGVAVSTPASLFDELLTGGGIRRAVERVLPDEESQLLIVVDQLEELYTLTDGRTANRFLDSLVDAVKDEHSRVRVVVTLRADFYDRPLSHRSFGELLRLGTEVVTPMSPDEIERAIAGPADRTGVQFEPGVVAEIISEVADRPAALPLLQHALAELFDRRRGSTITTATYREVGGVAGALGDRAESLFNGLDPDAGSACREIFLRLVSLGEGNEGTRRRVLLSELASLEASGLHVDRVVQPFGRHRLLSFDRDPVSRGPTVEIAHEALLTEWPRLQRWIEEGHSDIEGQRRLAAAAAEWVERDGDEGYVLSGARLTRYEEWLEDPPVELTGDERRFLESSQAARRAEEQREQEHSRRRERLRRRNRLLFALGVVTIVVFALGAFAFIERQRAEELADELAFTERARHLTGLALLQMQSDPELATMLAVEAARSTAYRGFVVPEAMDALHASIQSIPAQYPVGPDGPMAVRGTTGVFLMPPSDLVTFAQGLVDREFTPEECARLFSGGDCPNPAEPLPAGLVVSGDYGSSPGPLPLAGTTVTIRGPQNLPEEVSALEASYAAITERTGIDIIYEPFAEGPLEAARDGNAGDIMNVPQPAALATLVAQGHLMDIAQYLGRDSMIEAYGEYLVGLATVGSDGSWPADDGGIYGVWVKIENKSLIWHPTPEFAERGYETPVTWDQLIELSDRMVADGLTPWCLGIGSGPGTGWPATDWVESIFLRTHGTDLYDQWVRHEIPFDHPAVAEAVRKVSDVAFGEDYVELGAAAVVEREFWAGVFQVTADPPQCWLYPLSSSVPSLSPEVVPGETADVMNFPVIDRNHEATTVIAGGVSVAMTDRPEVRAVMKELASPNYGVEAVRRGRLLVPHRAFDLDNYSNPTERRIAQLVLEAIDSGGARFDASDLMPPEIGQGAFWRGMTRLFQEGPDAIEEILTEIEQSWPEPKE